MTASKIQLDAEVSSLASTDTVTLSHYQIRSRLGEGGFGEVYEAWDSKLCRSVAIKRLKNLSSEQHPESLIKEARLAASLQHAAFVKIHAIEEDGNSQSIVMELVPGITLKEWIQTQSQDHAAYQQTALELVRQIAEAMQEAHASGLIHGDLKPSNLIVEPSSKVRILDFGLASKSDTQATTSLNQLDPQGTIAYMAPERLLGAQPNPQSDIYALGTILYELLTGARPYATLTGLALAAAHVQSSSDSWDYPATLSSEQVKLIRAMTARQPEQRLGSMQEVCTQVVALNSSGKLPTAMTIPIRTTWLVRWQRLAKKQRVAFGASVIAVLLIAGAWQLAPYAGVLQSSLAPYSEALELQQGLAALKLFDRPGSLDAADKNFNTVLSHNPNNAAAVAGLSLLYSFRYQSDEQDENWLQKADASAQQALKLNEQIALSHVANGVVLNLKGKSELGLIAQERALSLDPKNFFAWNEKTNVLRSLRRFADAMKNAELGLQHFPQERIFADQLGTIFFAQNDYKAAEQAFKVSIQLQPDAVFSYANLSAALMSQNRNDEALTVLQQGLQLRPSSWLFTNLGNAQFLRGDYVAAATAFELAVSPDKGNPVDYLGWANLADTLLWIPGRKDEARQAYDKARLLLAPRLARNPNDTTLVSRMGLYAARSGSKDRAQELIQKSMALAPKDPSVHFRAALAYEVLGNRAEALKAILKAKEFGYPISLIESEPDLLALRRDAGYVKN